MSVRTDVINLTVNINGDKGKNELNQLRKRAADLAAEMKSQERRTVEGRKAWAEMNKELQANQLRQAELRKQIGLTALSQKELTAELKKLQQLKNLATPQTKEFFELQKQIDAVSLRLKDVRNGTFGFKAMLGSIKDEVKQFGMLAASYLGFQFITDQARNLIRAQKDMADQNANIAKTTGLTTAEIRELNKELREMDTRTSNSRLRDLASEAGKLGIEGVDNISRFVEQADKIEVALGEDLGDGGLMKIAKIAGIFNTEMTNVASGINSVGQASAATEAYQVDFAFRMAGTAQTARIAAGDILGFAAALEVNGQQTETSATALNTFFLDFISKSDEFGRAAGFAKGELAGLVNDRGVNEAFLQWLQRLKEASPTTEDFIQRMRSLGIDGARGSNVMLVLAENLDMVRQQQTLANSEIEKGTSVISEYNTKNENFAAVVDKISKQLNTFFTSDSVNRLVTGLVSGFGRLLEFLPKMLDFVGKNVVAFGAWTAAIIVQAGWFGKLRSWISLTITGLHGQTAAQILATAAAKADIIATAALGVAKALLTGNMARLRQQWLLMNAAIGTNPFAVLLIAVGALIVAYNTLTDRQGAVSNALKAQTDVAKRSVEIYASQVSKVQEHVAVLRSEAASLDGKKKALSGLIALSPQYLSGLTLQNATTAEGKWLIDQYVLSLRRKAEEEARSAVRSELLEKQLKAQIEQGRLQQEYEASTTPEARAMYARHLAESGPDRTHGTLGKISRLGKEVADLGEQLKAIDNMTVAAAQKTLGTVQFTTGSTKRSVGDVRAALQRLDEDFEKIDAADKARIKANRDERKKLDAELAAIEGREARGAGGGASGSVAENKLRQLRQQIAAVKNELQGMQRDMEAGGKAADEQEIARVLNKYSRLLEEAKKYSAEHAELTKLQQQDLDLLYQKQFDRRSEEEYDDTLKGISSFYASERATLEQQYIDKRITREQFGKGIKKLEAQEYRDRATAAADYAATVRKAANDEARYKADAKKKEISEIEALEQQSAQDRVDAAERRVKLSAPGSLAELRAQQALLKARFEMEMLYLDKRSQAYIESEEALNQELQKMNVRYWAGKAAEIIGYLQQVGQIFSEYLAYQNEKDRAALQEEKDRNDEKRKQFKRQLDSKKISRATYDNEIAKLDASMEQKEKEYRRREAKRAKAAALMNAILSTAQGVARAYADYAFPYNLIVSAIVAGLGAVQVARISSQGTPTGRRGLIVPGPSHEDHGVDLIERKSGKVLANVEGGEPLWVFSKETYKNNKDILDELIHNSMNRNGARIGAGRWYQRNDQQINTARLVPLLRAGGNIATGMGSTDIANSNVSSVSNSQQINQSTNEQVNASPTTDLTTTNQLLAQIVQTTQATATEVATMKKKLKAVVSIKELHEEEDLLKKAQSVAGINQAA